MVKVSDLSTQLESGLTEERKGTISKFFHRKDGSRRKLRIAIAICAYVSTYRSIEGRRPPHLVARLRLTFRSIGHSGFVLIIATVIVIAVLRSKKRKSTGRGSSGRGYTGGRLGHAPESSAAVNLTVLSTTSMAPMFATTLGFS